MLNSGELNNCQRIRPPTPHWGLAVLFSLIVHASLLLVTQQQLSKKIISPQSTPHSMRVSVVRGRPSTNAAATSATTAAALTKQTANNAAPTTVPTPATAPTPVNTVVKERPKPVPLPNPVEPQVEVAAPSATPLTINPQQLQQAIRQAQTAEEAAAPNGYSADCPPPRFLSEKPDCIQAEAHVGGSEVVETFRAALTTQMQDRGYQARQRTEALLTGMDQLRTLMNNDTAAGRTASQQYYALEEEFFLLNPAADRPRSAPLSPTKSEAVRHDNAIELIGF
jgi:cytoskeletal protein RodZ